MPYNAAHKLSGPQLGEQLALRKRSVTTVSLMRLLGVPWLTECSLPPTPSPTALRFPPSLQPPHFLTNFVMVFFWLGSVSPHSTDFSFPHPKPRTDRSTTQPPSGFFSPAHSPTRPPDPPPPFAQALRRSPWAQFILQQPSPAANWRPPTEGAVPFRLPAMWFYWP